VSAQVIAPRTLVPLDIDAIVASVKKTGRLDVAHEANFLPGIPRF
jgi:pyruvate/2-oxoglutarate/acetoin dehydrogenase E1 component